MGRDSVKSPVSGVASRSAPRRVCRGANRKVSGASCEGNGTHPNFGGAGTLGRRDRGGAWVSGMRAGVGSSTRRPFASTHRKVPPRCVHRESAPYYRYEEECAQFNSVRLSVDNIGCYRARWLDSAIRGVGSTFRGVSPASITSQSAGRACLICPLFPLEEQH